MADIYTRIEGDPGFVEDKIEILGDLELLLTQIEVILFTRRTDVLGEPYIGANLDDMIFSTNMSASTIENMVSTQIEQYTRMLSNKYNVQTSCKFYKDGSRDLAVLDIIINGQTYIGFVFA